jgi:Class III cytochrome C family
MKLTIALVFILGCSALLLTHATQKTGKTVRPTPTPVPAKTPAKQTPTAQPTATTTPKPLTTPTPKPATTPTPAPTTTPASASGAKEPCEDKMQASGIPLCSKVQPKTAGLSKNSARAKPVAFSHEAHATLKYGVDGTKVIGCAECHHTDQPASALTGLLKTSYRDAMFAAASLAMPSAKPVLSCPACHAREGKKPDVCDPATGGAKYTFCPNVPTVKYPDQDDETVLTNDEAYHHNCTTCHVAAVAAHKKPGAPPFIKGAPPVSCNACHK